MNIAHETIDEQSLREVAAGGAVPGLLAVFSCDKPLYVPLAFPKDGGALVCGRTTHEVFLDDERLSRTHVDVGYEHGKFVVTDRGSRNGTFVDGVRIEGRAVFDAPKVLRIGRTLMLFLHDLRDYERGAVQQEGNMIIGPRLALALGNVARAATAGNSLLVTGESGAGKELAAKHYHAHSSRVNGPFIAVNCAAIPSGVAERLLFGTTRGAYSGATESDGYAQAANSGTLFLDEIAELEPVVQPKLLRLLESGDYLKLGETRARRVDIRVVAATLKSLRAEAGKKSFREDLYYRIGQSEVRLPALRERLEEIPWLISNELRKLHADLKPHPQLVEGCLLRAWPGNVRELCHELRHAAQNALSANRKLVELQDLATSAGQALHVEEINPQSPKATTNKPSDEQIAEALQRWNGNVSATARSLGMHRTQLRRWIVKHKPNPNGSSANGDGNDPSGDDNDPGGDDEPESG